MHKALSLLSNSTEGKKKRWDGPSIISLQRPTSVFPGDLSHLLVLTKQADSWESYLGKKNEHIFLSAATRTKAPRHTAHAELNIINSY